LPGLFSVLVVFCAVLVTAAASTPEPALPDTLRVDRIGAERGLPSEIVNTLLMDRFGFLWIDLTELRR